MPPGPLTPHSAIAAWQFAPLASAGLAVAAAGYVLGTRVMRRRGGARWPGGRTAAFFAGLGVIAVATQGSPGVYDDVLFSAHMVQHVLLIMVAPPLLVYGRPVTLALRAARGRARRAAAVAVRSRAVSALTWPPAALAVYCVVVAVTHTPPVMDLVLRNGAVHDAEHVLYLLAGYLFFLPVAGSEPIRWRLSIAGRYLMLLAAMMVDSVTGAVFTFQSGEIFAPYARTGRVWGPSLVADLHLGGYVMIAGSDIAMTAVAVALAVRFYRDSLAPARSARSGSAAATAAAAAEARLAAYNAALRELGAGD
jgi:cytochrome c oxidase assembly factor CtaG